MELSELEQAMELQRRAYALLLWTWRTGREMLDPDALSSAASAQRWLARNWNALDPEHRPETTELECFSFMLTSFFNTSFHLERSGMGRGWKLVRGRQYKSGRNRKHARGRAQAAAEELARLALKILANEEKLAFTPEMIERVLRDPLLASPVALWAYGCEVVRRSRFASQGQAVHELWLNLEQEKRKRVTAAKIWEAREQLLEALKLKAHI